MLDDRVEGGNLGWIVKVLESAAGRAAKIRKKGREESRPGDGCEAGTLAQKCGDVQPRFGES